VSDPIDELLDAMTSDGKPSLAWIVRWSADGREPVAAAWEASDAGFAMLNLLAFAGRTYSRRRAMAAVEDHRATYQGAVAGSLRAAIVRREVPVPPTLEELMKIDRNVR